MRRHRSVSAGLVLVVASLLSGFGASAQPAQPAQPAATGTTSPPQAPAAEGDEKTADQYALEGREMAQKGDLAGAYKYLLIAWDLKKSYDIAGNLGVVELQLGKTRDAAEHLLFCKLNYPAVRDEALSQKLTKAEELLAKARASIGSVRIDVSAVNEQDSDGAEVYVGERLVGRSPIDTEVFVEPGSYTIKARLPGYDDAVQSAKVGKGEMASVKLVLVPAKVKPGGNVVVRPKSKALIGVGIGLAAAGVGVGIGFTLAANGKSREAENIGASSLGGNRMACFGPTALPDCVKVKDAVKATDTFSNVAMAGFIAGGVAALGLGTYLLLPAQKSTTAADVHVFPLVGSGVGGLGIAGSL